MDEPPIYARSILQAAKYDKPEIIQAILTCLPENERISHINMADKDSGRNALMFAAYHESLSAIEYLAASGGVIQLYDQKGRTCLHYAAMNDNAKLIETIFLSGKAHPMAKLETSVFEEIKEGEKHMELEMDEIFVKEMLEKMEGLSALARGEKEEGDATEDIPC